MFRTAAFASALLVAAGPVTAQGLKWDLQVEKQIATAKKTRQPIMFYIVGRSGDRENSIETAQRASFRDGRVKAVGQQYVRVQLSRSRYRDMLKSWHLPPRTNMEIIFTTPEGELIDRLAPSGIADADSFTQKMVLVFRNYRNRLFDGELKPVLEGEDSKPSDVRLALKLIDDFRIMSADKTLVQMLERKKLSARTRPTIYGILATLSTNTAADALFEASAKDKKAEVALGKSTPAAAEFLLKYVGGEDEAKHLRAYKAVTKICKIKKVKPERFWKGTIERMRKEEVERVRGLVRKTAKRWRARYEEYR